MKKSFLFIRLNVLYMFRNKARFILTLTGITIGLFIYMLGNVGVDCYLDSLYRDAYDFDENSIYVHDMDGEIIDRIRNYDSYARISRCCSTLESYSTDKNYVYKNVSINNSVELVGLNNGIMGGTVPYVKNEGISLARAKLLYGNDFSDEDIRNGTNSVIIEKSTALFWFQKENAVGENVDIISPYGYDRFVIVGVIEDLPGRRSDNMKYNKTIQQNITQEFSNSSVAYTTYNYLMNMVKGNGIVEWYTVSTADSKGNDQIENLIEELNSKAAMSGTPVSIITQQRLLEEVSSLERLLRGFINAIVVALILISGFMIVTIYVFSVKERTYEIGVRRALGAAEFDIVVQFVLEGIVTSLVASISVLLFGAVICNLATSYLINKLYMDIRLVFSEKLILSVIGLAMLQGILFSLMPALIASKTRPTEAIRWD